MSYGFLLFSVQSSVGSVPPLLPPFLVAFVSTTLVTILFDERAVMFFIILGLCLKIFPCMQYGSIISVYEQI